MTNEQAPPPVKPFRNPYEEADPFSVLQVKVARLDYKFIQSICPSKMSATFGVIFQKLVQTLQARGITDMSNEADFITFINNLVLTDQTDYEQLRIDSTNWQQHLVRERPVERRPLLGGRLPNSTSGGTDLQANASVDGAGATRSRAGSAPESNVLSDVQSKSPGKGKRKSREDNKNQGQ